MIQKLSIIDKCFKKKKQLFNSFSIYRFFVDFVFVSFFKLNYGMFHKYSYETWHVKVRNRFGR